ncbi:MAG: polysaccharide pyruvyl transferase family protein, partial [bacterium]
IFPARIFQLLGKPVYLAGVGGGPLQSPFLRRSAVRMLNRAACIATRDRETAAYFSFYGVRRPIHTGTDPALVMDATLLHTLPGGPLPVSLAAGKHYLFLHLMDKPEQDRRMAQEVVPAVNAFLSAHPDWDVIAGTDECTPPERLSALASWRALRQERAQRFSYDDIFTLCRLLERMELVVTAKLHVGVVSASLGASVLSFPLHPEKTMRFYRQIGEEGRCFPLASLQQKNIAAMLDYYADTPIRLPESVRRDAAAAFSALTALFQEGEK